MGGGGGGSGRKGEGSEGRLKVGNIAFMKGNYKV